ncbi:MAG: hypothetical protein ACM3U2_04220 [Deltaproteobacteria bacterium]
MQKSRAYRATNVKQISVEQVLEGRPAGTVHVGLDVGKEEIYAVVRWSDGTFGRPWKALNPSEVDMLVEIPGKISTRALSNLDLRVATIARAWGMSLYSMLSRALASVAAT